DLDDSRDVADKATMPCNTEAATGGQLPPPASFLGDQLGDPPQPPGVYGVDVVRLAVIPPRRGGLFRRLHDPRRTNQLQQHVLGIAAELLRDLGDERLDRPSMRHVVDRPEPANADM